MAIECSVVVPVFNEEPVIAEFDRRLGEVLAKTGMRYEILYVNDGSTDRSMELLREFATRDQAVRVISLSRNFAHQIAITAGLDMSEGQAVVVIDATCKTRRNSSWTSRPSGSKATRWSMRSVSPVRGRVC